LDDDATRLRSDATQLSDDPQKTVVTRSAQADTEIVHSGDANAPAAADPPRAESAKSTIVLGSETTVAIGTGATGTQVSVAAGVEAQASDDEEDDATDDLNVGDVLKDRFVIDKIIGRGGMGVVYRARDLRKEETEDRDPYVAVKVLGEAFRRDPRMVVALQREARKAQTLAHPAIATVYDFDREGDRVYLTMEVLEGQPVDDVVSSNPNGMPVQKAFEIVRGMCLGLAYAHNKNIIHSDFKPGNVFLTEDGRTKVLDFGIARAAPAGTFGSADLQKYSRSAPLDSANSSDTVFDAGSLGALTPAYASCEMFEGKEPHPADDVYALALTHYELLTGKHPFGNAPAPAARDAGMVPEPIPGLPRRHWKAILKGLAFAREDRSQHAAEYLSDLDGKTRTRLALAATLVLLIGTAGYLGWDQSVQLEVAKPDIPFAELAGEVQAEVTQRLSDGDKWLSFNALNLAYGEYLIAYEAHPRNPEVVARLEDLMAPLLELAAAETDPEIRAGLAENIRDLADKDDFLRRNAVLRDALEQLKAMN